MPRTVEDEYAVYGSIFIDLMKARGSGVSRTSRERTLSIGSEDGLSMIEVVISSMIVALIAVATLTGFSNAGRATARGRNRAQAAACAQQNEEKLRGLTIKRFESPEEIPPEEVNENCQPHKAGETGTVYTVISRIVPYTESESGVSETCTVEKAESSYVRTTTEVTWPALGKGTPVRQSSIVTVALSASLIVKVINQNQEPVEGVTIKTTDNSSIYTQTTGAGGCVLYDSLPAASNISVEASKLGWVDKTGNANPTKTTSVIVGSPSSPVSFEMGQAGRIVANFVDASKAVKRGDTFVAFHNGAGTTNPFDLEGTIGTYATAAESPMTLFPFVTVGKPATSSPYTVYAGDCTENNPETVTSKAVKSESVQVEPGETKTVSVVVPPVNVAVYEGTNTSSKVVSGTTSKATLTNTKCAGVLPNNYTSTPSYIHTQKLLEGHLEAPNQPFGTFELCVSGTVGSETRRWKTTFTNNTNNGPSATVGNGGTITTGGTTYGVIYLSGTGAEKGSC